MKSLFKGIYFFDLHKLKLEIKKQSLEEYSLFRYLLGTIILQQFVFILFVMYPYSPLYAEVIVSMIIIFGTYQVYIANGGAKGKNFLERYTSIGFILGNIFFILSTLLFYIILPVLFSNMYMYIDITVIDGLYILSYIIFFWFFVREMKEVARDAINI